MDEEIELKLAVAPEHVERLRRHPILRTLKQRPGSIKRLVSTYYDTPSFALMQKAVALRVRKVGHERIQTIKREAAQGKSRIARREWERRIEGDRPDLTGVEDPVLRRLIAPHSEKGELEPVFVTDVKRQVWPLRVGTSEIECALDIGEIKANGKAEQVCEVELELKSGPPARLFELARRLNKAVPLRLEPTSKAERGYSLVTGTLPQPRKAEAVMLDQAMTVRDAFAAIARACIAHIVGNVECAHEGRDPEGVHQLRVGIRRLRAAFSVFRDAIPEADRTALGGELRWLQQELGPAREWDVFIDGTLRAVGTGLDGGDGLRAFLETAEDVRGEAYERTRAALANRRYTDLLLRLEAWLDGGLGRAMPAAQAAATLRDASRGALRAPAVQGAASLRDASRGALRAPAAHGAATLRDASRGALRAPAAHVAATLRDASRGALRVPAAQGAASSRDASRGVLRAPASNGAGVHAAVDVLDLPILTFSAGVLRARHAKVEKLGAKVRKLDETLLHEFRIRVKKLRYAIEFFRKLYTDKTARRYVSGLKELQDVLGTAHDALVARDLIPLLAARVSASAERTVGQLEGWCVAQVKHDRRRLESLWQDFAKLKPYWKSGG
jgi:inorganic triphosphatase YgiF